MGEKKKRKRLASPLRRKVHLRGREWTWDASSGTHVAILNPERTRKWDVPIEEIGTYAHDFGTVATPGEVKAYIENHLDKDG